MNRWQKIERLFHAVVDLPPAAREAFLQATCAHDPDLYSGVMELTCCDVSEEQDEPWAPAAAARLMVGSQALVAGDRLGPYEITSFLAAGGMGVVYRARDLRMHRNVAIKLCPDGFDQRFWREVQAVARLNHSNVCQLYDVGSNYLVMELIEGPTLAEVVREGLCRSREPSPLPGKSQTHSTPRIDTTSFTAISNPETSKSRPMAA